MMNWFWKSSSKQQAQVNEETLKKQGFRPENMEIPEVRQQPITNFEKDYEGFISPSPQQANQIINALTLSSNQKQHRHELGHSKGGKICGDKKQVDKFRSIGKQMVKLIGKKILSGDLNLTKISFPIKSMVPKTALENSTLTCCTMPYFMKKACQTNDPIEKMKYVLTSITSSAYYMNLFMKPLNPTLGETLQGSYPDGTQIYCEQISHHPPITYFLVVGPQQSYKYSGYYAFEITAGLNSVTLTNKGKRKFQFKTGECIEANFGKQIYSGGFIGTLRSETTGGFVCSDEKNGLKCQVKFGKVKNKASDYIQGSINKDGKAVCKYDGSYCGFLNFDGVRYWDGQNVQAFKIDFKQNTLDSDFRKRTDLQRLKEAKITEAQTEKERIEQVQRRDAKLRQQNKKK